MQKIYIMACISAILIAFGISSVAGALPAPEERWWVIGALAIVYGGVLSYYTWYRWRHR